MTGYRIERCAGTGCSNFAQIATTTGATAYTNTGLTAGTSYRYRVRATDAATLARSLFEHRDCHDVSGRGHDAADGARHVDRDAERHADRPELERREGQRGRDGLPHRAVRRALVAATLRRSPRRPAPPRTSTPGWRAAPVTRTASARRMPRRSSGRTPTPPAHQPQARRAAAPRDSSPATRSTRAAARRRSIVPATASRGRWSAPRGPRRASMAMPFRSMGQAPTSTWAIPRHCRALAVRRGPHGSSRRGLRPTTGRSLPSRTVPVAGSSKPVQTRGRTRLPLR